MSRTPILAAIVVGLVFVGMSSPRAVAVKAETRPGLRFAQVAHASGSHQDFAWPKLAIFNKRMQKVSTARSVPLVRGTILTGYSEELSKLSDDEARYRLVKRKGLEVHEADVVLALSDDGVFQLANLSAGVDEDNSNRAARDVPVAVLRTAEVGKAVFHRSGGTAVLFTPTEIVKARPAQRAAWADWTYAATLVEMEGAVYDRRNDVPWKERAPLYERGHQQAEALEAAKKKGATAVLKLARAIVAEPPDSSAQVLVDASALAMEHGEARLARQLRALYRPVGRCSMDFRPQEAAAEFADLCFAQGDLPCFLQLQVRIMGQQFERVAYSSYGDAAHDSQVERLARTGVVPSDFLVGLLMSFDTSEERASQIGTWRLARAFADGEFGAAGERALLSRATDPTLDVFNRVRATQTLAYARIQAARAGKAWKDYPENKDVLADVPRDGLHPYARAWLGTL
jgi:hypothetical protein